jgi:hypothetical protein
MAMKARLPPLNREAMARVNKSLRRCLHIMLFLKSIRVSTVCEPIILNLKPFAFEKVYGLDTKGTDVFIRDHAVNDGFFALGRVFHGKFFCNTHICLLPG